MASQPISALTQFTPAGRMLIPVVDPAASTGLKNGAVLISALLAQLSEAQEGSQIYAGTGQPSEALGNNGDYYIDQSTGYLFGSKSGGLWPTSPIALTGPAIAAAQATANAAMPNTVAALAALFAEWVAANPSQFWASYLVAIGSLPTTAAGAAGTLANIGGIVQELQP